MLRNQATALLKHEHLTTTVPKAKELRPFVERLITVAKRGLAAGEANGRVLTARRLVMHDVQDREVVSKLFDTIAPRGDSAEVAQVELVGSEFDPKAKAKADEGEEGAKPKATGVAGRLRAAAERLRGKKESPERSENEAVPKRGGSKGGAPRKKGTTGRKVGGS